MTSIEESFYLTSTHTQTTTEVQALADAIDFCVHNPDLILRSLHKLCNILFYCNRSAILGFTSSNTAVRERLARVQHEQIDLSLHSMYAFAPVEIKRNLVHYALNAVRSTQEILQDDLRISAKFYCTDTATLLLSFFRLYDIPCRLCWYIYREPDKRLSASCLVEALINGQPHIFHQGRHGIFVRPELAERYIPKSFTPSLLRTPDAQSGIDLGALTLFIAFEEYTSDFDFPTDQIAHRFSYENGESRLIDVSS